MAGVNTPRRPKSTRTILASYEQRFLASCSPTTREVGFENFYDAPWWLIYSIAAGVGTNSRFDGLDLVDGMDRLQDGTPYAMGPDDLENAMSDLSRNANRFHPAQWNARRPELRQHGHAPEPGLRVVHQLERDVHPRRHARR